MVLTPEEIEATFAMYDSRYRRWFFHLMKRGGGTIGQKYVGEWRFMADLEGNTITTVAGSFSTGMPKDHAEAAREGWDLILAEHHL